MSDPVTMTYIICLTIAFIFTAISIGGTIESSIKGARNERIEMAYINSPKHFPKPNSYFNWSLKYT